MNEPSLYSQIIIGFELFILLLVAAPLVVMLICYVWHNLIGEIKDTIEDYKIRKEHEQRRKAVQMKEELFKLIKYKFSNL